jgi:hypothetical protein
MFDRLGVLCGPDFFEYLLTFVILIFRNFKKRVFSKSALKNAYVVAGEFGFKPLSLGRVMLRFLRRKLMFSGSKSDF